MAEIPNNGAVRLDALGNTGGTDEWPAGFEKTTAFAEQLCAYPGGFSITAIQISNQIRMQQGRAPEPHPCEVLVATGLASQESGFVFPTPALRAALALFGSTDGA